MLRHTATMAAAAVEQILTRVCIIGTYGHADVRQVNTLTLIWSTIIRMYVNVYMHALACHAHWSAA